MQGKLHLPEGPIYWVSWTSLKSQISYDDHWHWRMPYCYSLGALSMLPLPLHMGAALWLLWTAFRGKFSTNLMYRLSICDLNIHKWTHLFARVPEAPPVLGETSCGSCLAHNFPWKNSAILMSSIFENQGKLISLQLHITFIFLHPRWIRFT